MLSGLWLICTFPLSMRDISSTSLTRLSKCPDEPSIFCRQSRTLSLSSIFFSAISVIPIMPLIGVRISCDIWERKSLFAMLAAFAASAASFSRALACLWCAMIRRSPRLEIKKNISSPIISTTMEAITETYTTAIFRNDVVPADRTSVGTNVSTAQSVCLTGEAATK